MSRLPLLIIDKPIQLHLLLYKLKIESNGINAQRREVNTLLHIFYFQYHLHFVHFSVSYRKEYSSIRTSMLLSMKEKQNFVEQMKKKKRKKIQLKLFSPN